MRASRTVGALACLLSLGGCAEYTAVATTPAPSATTLQLPPIGFSHRYGNSPVTARDGVTFERQLYATNTFWEVDLQTTPVAAGYVDLADQHAVLAARHAVRSLILVLATEEHGTIAGLLDTGSHAGQEAYAVSVLQVLRDLGYDALTSAQVRVYFSEKDEHALLSWTSSAGYTFTVFDNDLQGSPGLPALGGTPLPIPTNRSAPTGSASP